MSFRELPSTSRWQTGRTVNISQTGVLFRSAVVKSELSIGTPLEFVVVLSAGAASADDSSETGVAHCTGRIVRHESEPDSSTRTGIVATIDQYQLTRLPSISSLSGRIGAAVESAIPTVGASTNLELTAPDLELASRLDVSVLITAGTRSARESAARLIHGRGIRGLCRFVHVRCDSLRSGSDGLPAWRRLLAEARGGTLFLDEVGEMSQRLQCALFEILNGARPDVRIIAATGRPLQEQIAAGDFHVDLFYRINVIHIECCGSAIDDEALASA